METPNLAERRERVNSSGHRVGKISVREVVADVQHLYADESNAGSLFQVTPQFNLLETESLRMTRKDGFGIYRYNLIQCPACTAAGGTGTIHRNYLAIVNAQVGQSSANQIDCL